MIKNAVRYHSDGTRFGDLEIDLDLIVDMHNHAVLTGRAQHKLPVYRQAQAWQKIHESG